MLIKYRPKKSQPSKILNDFQISNLVSVFPSRCRSYGWNLLYRLSDHGVSMNTFMKMVDGYSDTVIIFEDEHGYKFGGFCCEEWMIQKHFFGNGENFVFTFQNEDSIKHFPATNNTQMY